MKRVFLILLSVCYLGLSSGFTMHFHYCMGQLVKWGIAEQQQSLCGYCGKTKSAKKSCCKDDYKQAKVDQSQKLNQQNFQFEQASVAVTHTMVFDFQLQALGDPIDQSRLVNAPPGLSSVPVFILNCTYRI